MLVNKQTLERVLENDFRTQHPDVSFPATITEEIASEYGFAVVVYPDRPESTNLQKVVDSGTEVINGVYQAKWLVVDLVGEELAQAEEHVREAAKAHRQKQVESIKVTTASGKTFDGDETSQNRMSRAIQALQITSTPSVNWILADNTVIAATVAELSEALALAGAEQARLWVM